MGRMTVRSERAAGRYRSGRGNRDRNWPPDGDHLHGRATLLEGEAKVQAVRAMFDVIAPRYDLVNRIMTLRLDVGWRRTTVRSLGLGPGATVLDLAAGTGDLCRELARARYRAIGVDLSLGMLRHARTDAPLVQGDALRLPLPDGAAEGAVSGFALRNFATVGAFFDELRRVVRPGGRIALLEVSEPHNRLLRAGHALYFGHVVPRIGAVLSDPAAYRYLPESVAYLPTSDCLIQQLGQAGFGALARQSLSGGIAQLITATRVVEW